MERELQGTPVVPGVGWGPVVRPAARPDPPVGVERRNGAEEETRDYLEAKQVVIDRLTQRAERSSGAARDVLMTTATIAGDPALAKAVSEKITDGYAAVQAVWITANSFIEKFSAAGGMLAERTTDVADVRDRLVAELLGKPEPGVPVPTEPSVLLADDLAPADTALLDPRVITAIAIRLGGPTSHTTIIARELGIPCVVAVTGLEEILPGQTALVDGSTGVVQIDPDPQEAEQRQRVAAEQAAEIASWRGQGRTRDGIGIELLANVQDGTGARTAAQGVAVGVGLFRTELTFLASHTEPSIEEQATAYAEVLRAFPDQKVVVRTLDAGSDKPLAFMPNQGEENPALGMRGIRVVRESPEILERQLDAIAEAAASEGVHVMAPMVATPREAREFAERCRARGLIPGIMIEIPAAALRARNILDEVDFVSIGTNDLAQYTMAADRLSPVLSNLCDPWQPAMLELVRLICEAGTATGKPVGVCGESAADPLLATVLVGLGVSSLSAASRALPAVGAALSKVDLATCRKGATAALDSFDATQARARVREVTGL